MKTISVTEARTHFSRIINEVESGQAVVITRRGTPVARIVPMHLNDAVIAAKIDEWFEYRNKAGISLDGLTYRDLIDNGRRY